MYGEQNGGQNQHKDIGDRSGEGQMCGGREGKLCSVGNWEGNGCISFRLNPVHASSYNLILFYHLHLRLPSGLFPSVVHTKTLREILSSIRAICSAYLIIFYLFFTFLTSIRLQ